MSRLPDPGSSCAVLIGTSLYEHLDSLPAVANNVSSLARVLSGPTSWGLEAARCTVVSEPSSGTEILDAVETAARLASDTLLVYYSGHGLQTHRGELYLTVSGSVPRREDTGLPYRQLRDMILNGQAERHVVVLDCCFSGKALGTMTSSPDLVEHAEIEGTYVLAAAPENRLALAPPGETHTAFTGELLDVLWTGIPGGPPLLELDVVYTHLRRALTAKGRPTPQKRDRNTAGQLALGHNPAYRLPSSLVTDGGSGSTDLPWPDPEHIRTAQQFIDALSQVRRVSGMRQIDISRRSGGRIATSTISHLLNRTTLPRNWKTPSIYLSTCGIPADQLAVWESAWDRLRTYEIEVAKDEAREQKETRASTVTRDGIWRKLARRNTRTGDQ
ncbi:caspase domain-containing protein [Streptomyces sp. SLBN-118]|uniref:caspase family protein n=1 Tax=Streptomyces sp. SLBN-118 TaxID=2768454 RepID=UPI00114E0129|nr:caspase family protein [Streptomyces sp. SLBN-118]TQK52933.1 caspase domain-containing protein [Streptomyces sp. SLBN-118]